MPVPGIMKPAILTTISTDWDTSTAATMMFVHPEPPVNNALGLCNPPRRKPGYWEVYLAQCLGGQNLLFVTLTQTKDTYP